MKNPKIRLWLGRVLYSIPFAMMFASQVYLYGDVLKAIKYLAITILLTAFIVFCIAGGYFLIDGANKELRK